MTAFLRAFSPVECLKVAYSVEKQDGLDALLGLGLMKEPFGFDDFSGWQTLSAFLRFSFRLCGSKRRSWGRWA
jgi:hypothetical protein